MVSACTSKARQRRTTNVSCRRTRSHGLALLLGDDLVPDAIARIGQRDDHARSPDCKQPLFGRGDIIPLAPTSHEDRHVSEPSSQPPDQVAGQREPLPREVRHENEPGRLLGHTLGNLQ
jgi:hypothetical protein